MKKKIHLQVNTEVFAQALEQQKLGMEVSQGGSLHNLGAGLSITKIGVKSGKDKVISLTESDLEVLGNFGRGSSGTVKKVKHKVTGEIFAVKEIKLGGDRHLDEISKELTTLYGNKEEGLISPHIIDFKGAYTTQGSVFIALEAMDGSLLDLIYPQQGVPERVLACILKPILTGLNYLHKTRKLVHRDIKPANLLFRRDGTIKITDFGVCSQLENTKAAAISFVGTVTYMSPERLEGEQHSFSADIWGIGISVIQLATSEHPYEHVAKGETEAKFWAIVTHLKNSPPPDLSQTDFSKEFCDFVGRCVIKDKNKRPTASQLLEHPWITDNTNEEEEDDKKLIQNWICSIGERAPTEGISETDLDSQLNALVDRYDLR